MCNMSQNEEEQFKEIRAWKAFLSGMFNFAMF